MKMENFIKIYFIFLLFMLYFNLSYYVDFKEAFSVSVIEIKNLTKKYGAKTVVDKINFTVEKGDIMGLLGPNGAGKSTTMNILTGYLSLTEGSVSVCGFDILENSDEAKKHIGYLPEIPPLYIDMTVLEYLSFVYDLKKIKLDKKEHID